VATLDIFAGDAFSVISLTDAINRAPYVPGRIGKMGLFTEKGITTTTAWIEEKDGHLSLIQTSPRGGPEPTIGPAKRTGRNLTIPHLSLDGRIGADQVQNIRAFGAETDLESVQQVVNDLLADMRRDHEVTLEHLRAGAVQGIILDADGSTLYNLFTEFGVVQQTQAFAFTVATTDIRAVAVAVARKVEDALQSESYTSLHALCGATFFDALISHATVREAYKYQEGAQLRDDLRNGFRFGGIDWEEYRCKVGTTSFVAATEAFVFPIGSGIFKTYFAPADFIETVNTRGLPLYAKQGPDPSGFNRFVAVTTQANPLPICSAPRAVVKCTMS
jgi:hypothetical protein